MLHPRTAYRSLLLVAMALVVSASAASAQIWAEVGDAGDLVATAQTTVGATGLTSITGTLSSPTDVDVYCVQIGPAPRVPGLPVVSLQCAVNQGPNVFVFDAASLGISTNETCQGGGKTLTTSSIPLGGQGTFYVAVSWYGITPISASGAMWLTGIGGERVPDGPGAAGALTGWSGTPVMQPVNSYQVNLSYSTFCEQPTPTVRSTWGGVKNFR